MPMAASEIEQLIKAAIPDADVSRLNEMGVRGVFQPGTPMQEIVDFINRHARARVGAL